MAEYHDYTEDVSAYSNDIESLTLRDSNFTLTVLKKDGTEIIYDCPEILSFSHEFVMTKTKAVNQSDNFTLIDDLIETWISENKLSVSI